MAPQHHPRAQAAREAVGIREQEALQAVALEPQAGDELRVAGQLRGRAALHQAQLHQSVDDLGQGEALGDGHVVHQHPAPAQVLDQAAVAHGRAQGVLAGLELAGDHQAGGGGKGPGVADHPGLGQQVGHLQHPRALGHLHHHRLAGRVGALVQDPQPRAQDRGQGQGQAQADDQGDAGARHAIYAVGSGLVKAAGRRRTVIIA
ncbi:MAG: hypothetical protein V1797_18630 [Pseudomonadota bacterium]